MNELNLNWEKKEPIIQNATKVKNIRKYFSLKQKNFFSAILKKTNSIIDIVIDIFIADSPITTVNGKKYKR